MLCLVLRKYNFVRQAKGDRSTLYLQHFKAQLITDATRELESERIRREKRKESNQSLRRISREKIEKKNFPELSQLEKERKRKENE